MQGRGWLAVGAVCAWWLIGASGCVSLGEFDRMKAANRTLTAEKESVGQNLYDERQVNDSLRTKVDSLNSELATKNELLANLRGENDLLEGYRKLAVGTLEDMQNRQQLGDIMIPKLPAPLDTALKQFAEKHPNEVAYDAAHGTVKWKADLLFPLGSDEVKSASLEGLRGFTDILKSSAAADFEVVIVGHTDTRPIQKPQTREKHPTNWHLSAHRAIAVGNAIVKDGYRPERVGCMGCGEYRPVADNSSEAGSELNRRVEIYLVPVGSIVSSSLPLESPRKMETKQAKSPSKSAPLAAPTSGKPTSKRSENAPKPAPAKPESDEP